MKNYPKYCMGVTEYFPITKFNFSRGLKNHRLLFYQINQVV